MRHIARRVLHSILPTGAHSRRLWFGPARGARAAIDFRWDLSFFWGRHERALHSHYRQLVQQGTDCFDVGTYRGWDALTMARLSGGRVASFDCNAECTALARQFLAPSGYSVQLITAYISDGSDGDLTLDDAMRTYFVPGFVKVDVEGAEAAVLRGARSLLSEARPHLIVEVHHQAIEAECIDMLRRYGYTAEIVERGSGLFSEFRPLAHNRWLVCRGKDRPPTAARTRCF